ncbi:hypothetical protein CR103_21750, partial [Massilia psychrophila]
VVLAHAGTQFLGNSDTARHRPLKVDPLIVQTGSPRSRGRRDILRGDTATKNRDSSRFFVAPLLSINRNWSSSAECQYSHYAQPRRTRASRPAPLPCVRRSGSSRRHDRRNRAGDRDGRRRRRYRQDDPPASDAGRIDRH